MNDQLYPLGAFLFNPAPPEHNIQAHLTSLGLRDESEIPKSFDWRKNSRGFSLSHIFNQSPCACGNCWVLSSVGALADRFRIGSPKYKDLNLNPSILTACFTGNGANACTGGFPFDAGKYFEDTGCPVPLPGSEFSKECTPAKKGVLTNSCASLKETYSGKSMKAIKGSTKTCVVKDASGTIDRAKTIAAIKLEVMKNGPVVAGFIVFKDFLVKHGDFPTGGVYIYDGTSAKAGGHAVEIVGWGVQTGIPKYGDVPYWIVKNSWGDLWGDKGFFKMAISDEAKGINVACGFDIPIQLGHQLFGGTTVFSADLEGAPPYAPLKPTPRKRHPTGHAVYTFVQENWWKIILVIIGVTVLVTVIAHFIKKGRSAPSRVSTPKPVSLPSPVVSEARAGRSPIAENITQSMKAVIGDTVRTRMTDLEKAISNVHVVERKLQELNQAVNNL